MNCRGWTELVVALLSVWNYECYCHIHLVIRYNALHPRRMMGCDLEVIVADTLLMNSGFFLGQYLAVFEVSFASTK